MIWAVPESETSGSLAQEEEGSAVLGNVSDTSTWVDFPLAEGAKLSLDDHRNIMIKIYQLNNQKINNPSPPLLLSSPFPLQLSTLPSLSFDLIFIIINNQSWILIQFYKIPSYFPRRSKPKNHLFLKSTIRRDQVHHLPVILNWWYL